MDKNVVLMAEQVGVFLAPTLRAIAAALINESIGTLVAKTLSLQSSVDELRAAAEAREKEIGLTVAELRAKNEELKAFATESLAAYSQVQTASEKALAELSDLLELKSAVLESTVRANVDLQKALSDFREQLARDLLERSAVIDELGVRVEEVRVRTLDDKLTLTTRIEGVAEQVRNGLDNSVKRDQELSAVVADLAAHVSESRETTLSQIATVSADLTKYVDALGSKHDDLVELVEQKSLVPPVHVVQALDPEVVVAEVARAVAAIEIPQPEKIDPVALTEMVEGAVEAEVERAIPPWRAALAATMSEEVARAVAALPVPKDGKDGEPGPAGVMGVVEPYIEDLVYERAALVLHAGGTWQATRRTKSQPAPASRDWQAIAVGVAGVSAKASDDLRTFEVVSTLTDGTEAKHAVTVPAMVYRDIFEDSVAYAPADVVTYAGSMWVALKDTTGEQPSKSPEAWRLIVKRGQEGRAGKDGADGVQFKAEFEGEYQEDHAYPKNSVVTYASSVWMAKRPTKERPPYMTNADSEHWLRLR